MKVTSIFSGLKEVYKEVIAENTFVVARALGIYSSNTMIRPSINGIMHKLKDVRKILKLRKYLSPWNP